MNRTLTFVGVMSALAVSASAEAYRPSHGFLNGTQCDAHRPVTLEVPPNSQPVPNPFAGEYSGGFFHVEEIRDGLYYMTDGVYQAVFLVSRRGIILVDAPPSIGFNNQDPSASVSIVDVVHSLPETAGLPIKKLIYSHSHVDHIGAAGVVKDAYPKVQIIAHAETKKAIARGGTLPPQPVSGLPAIPVPNRSFRHHATVRLGKQRVRLDYRGPVHEPGNVFIWAPRQKVLMLVDTIFPGWSPFNDLALAEDVPVFLEAHDKVLRYPFETFVGGHINRLGTRSDVEESRLYMQDVFTNARRALDPTDAPPVVFGAVFSEAAGSGVDPRNGLGVFHLYLDEVACKCANLTLDASTTPSGTDWTARFGASDINTVGHCWQFAESLRVDHY